MDLIEEFKSIEDYLIPKLKLDPIEKSLYYHLLRHTRIIGREASHFGILSLSGSSGLSETTVRERIRILHERGCIGIEDRSAKGHFIRVFLPGDIDGMVPKVSATAINIDEVDFYSNRTYVGALVLRENGRCFYCLRSISTETCVLDHVIAQAAGGDNSYRNVVACCHGCNAAKQGRPATDFLRANYRAGLLSQEDLQERLATFVKLQNGQLIPEI